MSVNVSALVILMTKEIEELQEALATELANQERLVGEMQELRQVLKEYRFASSANKNHAWCRTDLSGLGDNRCLLCIKAHALLAKDTPTEPKSAPEEI